MANQDYIIGSVSQGTMRKEDLIPRFCEVAEELGEEIGILSIQHRMEFAEEEDNQYDYYNLDVSDYDLEALFNVLRELAPPYFYFGAHPADGADYGFWLCENCAEQVKDSGGFVVGDLAELDQIEDGGIVEVLYVNDHGNTMLYTYNLDTKELIEIWAIV